MFPRATYYGSKILSIDQSKMHGDYTVLCEMRWCMLQGYASTTPWGRNASKGLTFTISHGISTFPFGRGPWTSNLLTFQVEYIDGTLCCVHQYSPGVTCTSRRQRRNAVVPHRCLNRCPSTLSNENVFGKKKNNCKKQETHSGPLMATSWTGVCQTFLVENNIQI